jgi:elongation factor Ts
MQTVSKDLLAKLRKSTGYPILKCRQALVENSNNIDKAKVWLANQAEREGWARVEQLQQRKTSHGLVGVKGEKNCGVMVEVIKMYLCTEEAKHRLKLY